MIKSLILTLFFIMNSLDAAEEISPEKIFKLLDDENYFIKTEQLEINKFEAMYLANKGNFDLRLDSKYSSLDSNTNFSEFSAKLIQPLPFLGIELWGGYKKNQGYTPSYWEQGATSENGDYSLGLKLPILSGLLLDKNRFLLEQSFYQLEKSKIRYSQQYLEHYLNILNKFLSWYLSYRKQEVHQKIYELALKRQELITIKHKKGAMSKMDVIDNQNIVLIRKSSLENSINNQEMDKRIFKLFFDQVQKVNFSNETTPTLSPVSVDLTKNWVDNAFANRGDLKGFEFTNREMELNIKLQQQQRLPDLNLQAEYTVPRNQETILNETDEDIKLGLTFSLPLWQRKASGDIQKAKADLELEQLKQKFQKENIRNNILNLIDSIKVSESRLALASSEVENSQMLHKFEQNKMLEGLSSLINVNIREQAIAESFLRKIQIEADLMKYKIELLIASGQSPFY